MGFWKELFQEKPKWEGSLYHYTLNWNRSVEIPRLKHSQDFEDEFIILGHKVITQGGQGAIMGPIGRIFVETDILNGGAVYRLCGETDFLSRNSSSGLQVDLVLCGLAWTKETVEPIWSRLIEQYSDSNSSATMPVKLPWLSVIVQENSMLGANVKEIDWITDCYEGIGWAILDKNLGSIK